MSQALVAAGGSAVGTLVAFAVIAAFVRSRKQPSDTALTCAWCGHAIPMQVARSGGVGAVNAGMRTHMATCELHPMRAMESDLIQARAQLKTIEKLCEQQPIDRSDLQKAVKWEAQR